MNLDLQLQTVTNQVDPILERCTVEILDKNNHAWNDYREEVLALERQVFEEKHAFDDTDFVEIFDDSEAIIVFLRDSGKLVGLICAMPLSYFTMDNEAAAIEREDDGKHTAYIQNLAIHPSYRGHKLTPKMMSFLESILIKQGYTYIELDATTRNNYAANVEKDFRNRNLLLIAGEVQDTEIGPRRFFRAKLPEKK